MVVIPSIVLDHCWMELQQMRYAVAVAETLNFTRAAERSHVVQSALSHQITRLERELGVQLFARTSRRVEVTAEGEAFVAAARQCLAAAELAATAATVGEVRGTLSVGLIPTVAAVDVPAELQRFRDRHPLVRIRMRSGASDRLVAAVAAGSLDGAFLGLPESVLPEGVEVHELARDRHVLVVPEHHRLATASSVDLADLADEVFVDFPSDSPGRAQSEQAFAAAAVPREVAFEVETVDLMTRLVLRDLGVALLPGTYPVVAPGLVTVPVVDGPTRVEYLAWSSFNPSPAARAFVEGVVT